MISPLFFTNTVTLQRPTVGADSAGGATRSWASVTDSEDVPAAIQPANPRDILLYEGRQIQLTDWIYIEQDIGFERGDRLIADDGRLFTVNGVVDFAGFGRIFKLVAEQLLS